MIEFTHVVQWVKEKASAHTRTQDWCDIQSGRVVETLQHVCVFYPRHHLFLWTAGLEHSHAKVMDCHSNTPSLHAHDRAFGVLECPSELVNHGTYQSFSLTDGHPLPKCRLMAPAHSGASKLESAAAAGCHLGLLTAIWGATLSKSSPAGERWERMDEFCTTDPEWQWWTGSERRVDGQSFSPVWTMFEKMDMTVARLRSPTGHVCLFQSVDVGVHSCQTARQSHKCERWHRNRKPVLMFSRTEWCIKYTACGVKTQYDLYAIIVAINLRQSETLR